MTTLTARQFVHCKAAFEIVESATLIDLFTLALTHGLMAVAAFILLSRDELDKEEPGPADTSQKRNRPVNESQSDA